MFDCSDLASYGISSSGVYTLLSDDTSHPLSEKDVYCDMDTDRGGYNHVKLLFCENKNHVFCTCFRNIFMSQI